MLTTDLIEQILARLPTATVGLVGDLFLDRYLDIDPARDEPSVETGKTAYQVVGVRSYPGALGTVLNNLVALGVGRVVPVSVVGDDGEGYDLRQALAKLPAVDSRHVIVAADRRTPTYTKPMYGPTELNRLDIKNRTPTPGWWTDAVIERLEACWRQFDAVLVLDQVSEPECGVITTAVREWLGEKAAADPWKFVLADSRERIGLFRSVSVKPNRGELERFLGRDRRRTVPSFTDRSAFVTEGADGIRYFSPGQPLGLTLGAHVDAYPVAGPIDVCGAGDSCSAGIACGMLAGGSPEQAAAFGNLVASITVTQIGTTGTATPAQVRARWAEVGGG
jgi:bifunctional ADP-heptose synthase (sugar kinase/adenylyltransferase)